MQGAQLLCRSRGSLRCLMCSPPAVVVTCNAMSHSGLTPICPTKHVDTPKSGTGPCHLETCVPLSARAPSVVVCHSSILATAADTDSCRLSLPAQPAETHSDPGASQQPLTHRLPSTAILQLTQARAAAFSQYYTCSATGEDIPASLRGGAPGVIGCRAASLSAPIQASAFRPGAFHTSTLRPGLLGLGLGLRLGLG